MGLRLREYTPFTLDHKPPAFLPRNSRYTRLLMEDSHAKKHSGVDETVAQFRMDGFWTVQAAKLAKVIRSKCVICRFLDKTPISQSMGRIPEHQLVQPSAWGHVEIDLFGSFFCHSDVQKRLSCKVYLAN